MFCTYVLQSQNDGKLYTGFTKDLKLRFEQHNKGLVESTKERRLKKSFLRLLALHGMID